MLLEMIGVAMFIGGGYALILSLQMVGMEDRIMKRLEGKK